MKNKLKFALMAAVLGTTFFLTSCCREIDKGTQAKIDYLEKHKISYKEFVNRMEGNLSQQEGDENCTKCGTKTYCAISVNELKTNMINYRDNIWGRNCSFGGGRTTSTYDINNDKLDARFMEMDINDLENYICNVKKMAKNYNDVVQSVRFYYIQYPGTIGDGSADNAGCHSLAMVPFFNNMGDCIKEGAIFDLGGCQDNQDPNDGSIANHNQICPPMVSGCDISNTLITTLTTK